MMMTRLAILGSSSASMFKSTLITLRYSLLRKQFKDSSGEEIPIFNYQLQKKKIFAELSKAYAMNSSFDQVRKLVQTNFERCERNDFSLLKTAHIQLCGCKALFTWWLSRGMMNLMQACGGQGYSMYSGLPHLFRETFPDTILEGENSVLLLQVSQSLLKGYQRLQTGSTDKIQDDMKYMVAEQELEEFVLPETEEAVCNPKFISRVLEKATVFHVKDTAALMMTKIASGMDPKSVGKI